jgi:hypothetical protein
LNQLVLQARRDRPTAGTLAALARSLRVPFLAAPAAAVVIPSTATASIAAKLGLSRLGLWGWGAGSTIAITGAVVGVALSEPAPAPPAPAPVVAPVVSVAPKPDPAPPGVVEDTAEPEEASPVARVEPRVSREAPVVWNEPQLIERARRALATDPRRALMLTQEHQRRFPAGALGVERDVIAIEALARSGQTAEARRRALLFISSYPRSIHLPRVRALLARLDAQ